MTSRNALGTMTPSALHIALLALAAALTIQMASSSLALAQTDPKASADEHFRKGVAAFRDRRFGDAGPEFEEAYRLSPAYVVLYNIGQVNVALGRSVEAVDAYERYLKQGAAEIPPGRVQDVEAEIAKQLDRIGTVAIRSSTPGVEIRMDGRLVGTTPLPRPVHATVGRHTFEATRSGFATAVHEVEVIGKAERTLDLKLERNAREDDVDSPRKAAEAPRATATPPPVSPAPPTITFVEIPRPTTPVPSPAIAPTTPGINWQRVIGYVAVAGGLATTTVGGLVAFDGWNKMNDADDRLKNVTQAEYDARRPQYDLDYASAKHRNHVGWTVAGIGAAAVLGGIIVVATAPDRGSNVALGLTPTVVASANGLAVLGAW